MTNLCYLLTEQVFPRDTRIDTYEECKRALSSIVIKHFDCVSSGFASNKETHCMLICYQCMLTGWCTPRQIAVGCICNVFNAFLLFV